MVLSYLVDVDVCVVAAERPLPPRQFIVGNSLQTLELVEVLGEVGATCEGSLI